MMEQGTVATLGLRQIVNLKCPAVTAEWWDRNFSKVSVCKLMNLSVFLKRASQKLCQMLNVSH